MVKKIIFSARQDHEVINRLIDELRKIQDFELFIHDPKKDFF